MACYFNFIFRVMWVYSTFPSFSTDEARFMNTSSIKELLTSSYQESLQIVNEAVLNSRQRRSTISTSTRVLRFFRQTEPETMEISRAAEVFQTTLQVLKSKAKLRYKRNVVTSGKILSGEQPTLPWSDGFQLNTKTGRENPKPREISKKILRSSSKSKDDIYSQLLVEWGQYIDHDITFTPQSTGSAAFGSSVDCLNTCENVHPCFPIEADDVLSGAQGCMPFYRSTPACPINSRSDSSDALQRQQMNAITSFIDASVVYGHTPKLESFLRDLSGLNGKLAVNNLFKDSKGRPYLVFVAARPSACHQDSQGEGVDCFSAGDSRVNEVMPLITLHTLWLREHNRIAEALKHINAHWSPETIYQETRKIIGALHQIITMRDYVPKIIGVESFEQYIGPYGGYDQTVDPSASNVFATAAFRFGHATISPILRRLNESFQEHELFPHLRLHNTFFSPWRIVKEGGIEPVLRGIIGTPAPSVGANMLVAEEVTERLVVLNVPQYVDLASLNLQRGRDHALPGYNSWRNFCGLKVIKTLDDLREVVMDNRVAEKILKIYKHPDNIDVWLGGLVENLLPSSRTGPLFACLIGKQMKALRDGDRFWWEAEGVFTQEQKTELLKGSLSRIICDNSDIKEVPADSFRFHKFPSDYVSCNHIPSIHLEAWKEEENQERCPSPTKIKNGDFILSSTSGKLVALYSCYHGFKLKGAAAVVCEGNLWSDQPPQCTAVAATGSAAGGLGADSAVRLLDVTHQATPMPLCITLTVDTGDDLSYKSNKPCPVAIPFKICAILPSFSMPARQATYLTPNSLASMLKCSLETQLTYPVEVWKLSFRKASAVLDEALVSFASTAPDNSNPSFSEALDALEVRIANFRQTELQTDAVVSSWFQKKIHPFLASASDNFLLCLSVKNFSCHMYQTV
ncbi:Thyroid peroxidase [Channa argus]|uniref:Thyroid peroxidase n=1 Tax=Channa argus TaxID=215402 RepID=A0A6G1QGJ2_CHAAH|nr:Thyroid peroxidase [Channa argus]